MNAIILKTHLNLTSMKNLIVLFLMAGSLFAAAQSPVPPSPGILPAGAPSNGFVTAKTKARKEHKDILLTFSGSDWCIPCIKLEKQVFTSVSFKKFADSNLVVLNADFPRLKKHQLSKDKKAMNELLADQYNKAGNFPFTVLLDADGKVLKTWDGNTVGNVDSFTSQLEKIIHDR
jgi:thioredoxin-related protein